MPDTGPSSPVEVALDVAVRHHFESRHEAGLCVPFDQIGETSRRVVRNQLRGVVTAIVAGIQSSQAWTVPVEQRPACPLDGHPCTSWTCLVDVCVGPEGNLPPGYRTPDAQRVSAQVERDLMREVLEAVCVRDGLSLESSVNPGEPARNYELALRLGIGEVFGLTNDPSDKGST